MPVMQATVRPPVVRNFNYIVLPFTYIVGCFPWIVLAFVGEPLCTRCSASVGYVAFADFLRLLIHMSADLGLEVTMPLLVIAVLPLWGKSMSTAMLQC